MKIAEKQFTDEIKSLNDKIKALKIEVQRKDSQIKDSREKVFRKCGYLLNILEWITVINEIIRPRNKGFKRLIEEIKRRAKQERSSNQAFQTKIRWKIIRIWYAQNWNQLKVYFFCLRIRYA